MADPNRWNERYREKNTPWDTGQPSSELVRVMEQEKISPARAIELGCGTGANAVWLAQRGFPVTAVDISALAIDQARRRAQAANVSVQWVEANVLDPPPLGGLYSFFFDRGCYHIVRSEDVTAYLRTLEAITEPGARGLVLAGNAREPHDPGPPVVEEKEIRQELGRLFDILWLREIRFDKVEEVGVQFLGWSCFLKRRH